MASVVEVERVRQLLKRKFEGKDVLEALRQRFRFHLEDPLQDPLSRQVWPAYVELRSIVGDSFSILDAGCMSGFLYQCLKDKDVRYTGIDRWPEAIQVGKEFEPHLDLRVADFLTFHEGQYDFVWCSNIPWRGNDFEIAKRNLLPLAKRMLIFAHPNQPLEIYGA